MKSLSTYIKENVSHIRNIYILENDIDEQLNKIRYKNEHSKIRKLGNDDPSRSPSNNLGGVTNEDIDGIFNKIDHIILEGLELNKIKHTNKYEYDNEIGITKDNKNESIMIICHIVNYNENESKYDIVLVTVGRRKYFQEIDKVKLRIYIKGNYNQISWDV